MMITKAKTNNELFSFATLYTVPEFLVSKQPTGQWILMEERIQKSPDLVPRSKRRAQPFALYRAFEWSTESSTML